MEADSPRVSMIALGGPKLKLLRKDEARTAHAVVSMIALGGPKLKPGVSSVGRDHI